MKSSLIPLSAFLTLFSATAFAGTTDLEVFNLLTKFGVTEEYFMSQSHLGLDDVSCSGAEDHAGPRCRMIDISANEGQGGELILAGDDASSMIQLLKKFGMPGHADSIRCTQSSADVSDGTLEERTHCQIYPQENP